MPKPKYIPKQGEFARVLVRGVPYYGEVRIVEKGTHRFMLHCAPYHEFSWCWDDKSVTVTRLVEAK